MNRCRKFAGAEDLLFQRLESGVPLRLERVPTQDGPKLRLSDLRPPPRLHRLADLRPGARERDQRVKRLVAKPLMVSPALRARKSDLPFCHSGRERGGGRDARLVLIPRLLSNYLRRRGEYGPG